MNFISAFFIAFSFSSAFSSPPSVEGADKSEAESSHDPPPALLDQTGIGQAVLEGSLELYKKELEKIKRLSSSEALAILKAEDPEGNNIFHLMASSSADISNEITPFFIGFILTEWDEIELPLALNQRGLSPKDRAGEAGNSSAFEHLTYVENFVKQMDNTEYAVLDKLVEGYLKEKARREARLRHISMFLFGAAGSALLAGLSSQSLDLLVYSAFLTPAAGFLCLEVFKRPKL